jgi:hypothetical protein
MVRVSVHTLDVWDAQDQAHHSRQWLFNIDSIFVECSLDIGRVDGTKSTAANERFIYCIEIGPKCLPPAVVGVVLKVESRGLRVPTIGRRSLWRGRVVMGLKMLVALGGSVFMCILAEFPHLGLDRLHTEGHAIHDFG